MINNLNTLSSQGSVSDSHQIIVNGNIYTALQLKNFCGGDTSVFSGSEQILKADKNTGRGKLITLSQLKDYVSQASSPVVNTDLFIIRVSGSDKSVTATIFRSYLDNFSPTALSGLQVWYDMTDATSYSATGSSVTQIRDKSGNNNHSNPTTGQRMTLLMDTLTGKQTCYGSASNSSIPLTTPFNNSTYTFFWVGSNSNAGLFTNVLMGGSGFNDYIQGGGPSGNYTDSIISAQGGSSQSYQDDFTLKEMTVLCIRQQSGVTQIWECNGRNRIRISGSVPSVNFSIGTLCNVAAGGAGGQGLFGGFVYYNTFLNDSDAARVTKYLVDHHNINPSGQYYKITGFGDSYTIGLGASTLANSYIHKIAASLGKEVSNAGISGSRFQDITGTGGDAQCGYVRYARDLVEYPYRDRLYILYGFNDVNNGSASVSTYQTQLNTMVTDLISRGYPAGNIYLGTVPRQYGDNNGTLAQQYGNAVRSVGNAHGCHVAEVYAAQVANGGDSLFSGDHLHPNDTGHQVIANAFLAA